MMSSASSDIFDGYNTNASSKGHRLCTIANMMTRPPNDLPTKPEKLVTNHERGRASAMEKSPLAREMEPGRTKVM